MKYRHFIRNIKEETYHIPDIFDSIKETAYSRKPISPSSPEKRIPMGKMIFAPIMIIVLAFVLLSISSDQPTLTGSGGGNLMNFSSYKEISARILEKEIKEDRYKEQYSSENIRFYPSKNDRSTNSEADIVKTDGNIIYFANAGTFYAVQTKKGNMEIRYTDNYADYNERYDLYQRINELYVTDDSVVLIYNQKTEPEVDHEYTKYTVHITVYSKDPYDKVKEYSVSGNYMKSGIVNNTLYLISEANLSEFTGTKPDTFPRPLITHEGIHTDIGVSDIRYLDEFLGRTYTILSSIPLSGQKAPKETLLLTFDWDYAKVSDSGVYLIDSYRNYPYNQYQTSFMKFRYDEDGILDYSSSCTLRGMAADENSFDDYLGTVRIALSSENFRGILGENGGITEESITNQILILNEKKVWGHYEFQLTESLDKGIGSGLEYIKSVRFYTDSTDIVTSQSTVYHVNLSQNKPKIAYSSKISPLISYFRYLDDNDAVTIGKDTAGNYSVSFLRLENQKLCVWEQGIYEISNSYFDEVPARIDVEAYRNPKASYSRTYYNIAYFGFSIWEIKRYLGDYIVFEISVSEDTFKIHHLSEQNDTGRGRSYMISRMVGIEPRTWCGQQIEKPGTTSSTRKPRKGFLGFLDYVRFQRPQPQRWEPWPSLISEALAIPTIHRAWCRCDRWP
jgi:hypothetical protein